MQNKELLSNIIPIIHENVAETPAVKSARKRPRALERFLLWLRGGGKDKAAAPDPAADIIARIEDREIAAIVRDLHYRTPKSLQAMRNSCQECFVLPDDCPYYDYSTFDVKKAIKRLVVQPKHTHHRVVAELQKVNNELAYHLYEYLD